MLRCSSLWQPETHNLVSSITVNLYEPYPAPTLTRNKAGFQILSRGEVIAETQSHMSGCYTLG